MPVESKSFKDVGSFLDWEVKKSGDGKSLFLILKKKNSEVGEGTCFAIFFLIAN